MTESSHPQPRKILFVDDNRIILHLLRLTFANQPGYELFEASSGETALPIVLREKPDIIVLDVMMPGELDGFQLCQMIKSWPDTQHCCVIFLSACSQKNDIDEGQRVGADYYLTKPFRPDDLLGLIERHTEKMTRN